MASRSPLAEWLFPWLGVVFAGLRLWYFKYLRVSQLCKVPKQADGEEGHRQGCLIYLSKNSENSLQIGSQLAWGSTQQVIPRHQPGLSDLGIVAIGTCILSVYLMHRQETPLRDALQAEWLC